MPSVSTASDPVSALLACGGFRDPTGMVSKLASAAGLSFYTISGGGTLVASQAYIVLDGQGVTLPAAPTNGSVIVVVCAVPAAPASVTAGGSDNLGGVLNGSFLVGGNAAVFTYATAGTNWTVS